MALTKLSLAPIGLRRHQLDDSPQPLCVVLVSSGAFGKSLGLLRIDLPRIAEQCQRVVDRILPRGMCQLIGERLNCEGVINVRYRAQPADANVSRGRPVLRAEVEIGRA